MTGEVKKVVDDEIGRESKDGRYTIKWDSRGDTENGKRYYFFIRVYDSNGNYYTTPNIIITVRNAGKTKATPNP